MKSEKYDDIYDFCESIDELYEKIIDIDEKNSVGIIAKYDQTVEIVQLLICSGYSIQTVQLVNPDWNSYTDEYYISINDYCIFVEPMKTNNKYVSIEDTIVYVSGNCSSAVLSHIDSDYVMEISIDEEYDEQNECDRECECGSCCKFEKYSPSKISDKKKDVLVDKSETYFINGKECSKDEYETLRNEIMKNFADVCKFVNRYFSD